MTEEMKNENEGGAVDSLLETLLPPPETGNSETGTDSGQWTGPGRDGQPEGIGKEDGQYYTKEEFENILLTNPLDVEPDLVPPELMPAYKTALKAYKSFQADYTRKTQEISRIKQENQPKDIYEAYDRNPDEVIAYLDAEIVKAKDEADLDRATMLLNLKSNLLERKIRKIETNTEQEKKFTDVFSSIRKEIPDIETKAEVLTDFAISKLGFTPEEIEKLTDPAITGSLAAKLTLAVNRAYEMANAMKSAEKKVVRPSPPKLAPSGTSSLGQSNMLGKSNIWELSDKEFEKLVNKVKFSR